MSLRDELHRALQEFYDSSEPGPAGMTVNEELVDRVLMPVIERALATERVATIEECKRAAQAAPTFSNDLIGRGKSYAVKRIDELSHDRSALDAMPRPKIICLCGSTRFTDEMLVKQWELTKQGNIVLSWCALPESYAVGPHVGDREEVKHIVDEVHKRKIDLADEVFVLNIGGYIGESTRSEISYAEQHGKPVHYLEATTD